MISSKADPSSRPDPDTAFNLVRAYAVVALVVFSLAGLSLALALDTWFERNVLHLAEKRNQAFAHLVANTLWRDYAAVLREGMARELDEATLARLRADMQALTVGTDITKIEIFDTAGHTRFATNEEEIGRPHGDSEEFRLAVAGQPVSRFAARDEEYAEREAITGTRLISSYMPLYEPGTDRIVGVLELYMDAGELISDSEATLASISYAALGIMLVVYAVLFLLVRKAQRLITRQQEEIIQRATRDDLTGLPNRRTFIEQLEHALSHARRAHQQVGLLYIDLNHFKAINDGHGHHAGDIVLRHVATRMREVVRDYNLLARVGGDEFTLLVEGFEKLHELEALAQRLCVQIGQPVVVDGVSLSVSASIGIAVYPSDAEDGEALVRAADAAMYRAKQDEACSYHFYSELAEHQSQKQRGLQEQLEAALEKNEFELFFQPKVDVTTGSVVGAEALLRWRHPARGLVSPLDFIPALEESGLIVPVGEWVISETCEAQRRWLEAGLEVVPVAVNVSAQQFRQPGFAARVDELIASTGIDAGLLEIEMTESCLMEDVETNITVLEALKASGFRIAVDDFGTGYSSLSYLKKFPIDTLKIDRSFITNVHDRSENDNAAIVTAIMALSHSLRLSVVAEGVENPQELAYLSALGCRTIQGFLFSRPLEASAYEKYLRDTFTLQKTLEDIRVQLSVGNV